MGALTTSGRRAAIDARLLIGLGLVIASVVGVVGVVGALDTRTTVYAAASTLSPGDRIERADLVAREVALDGAAGLYVSELPGDGLVVVQPVREGELVPRTAVGEASSVASTALVLELAGAPSSAVEPGAVVDVWASPADAEGRGFGAPIVLVSDAVVVRVVTDDGVLAPSSAGAVEVLVPRARVARVLQSQAMGDALAVVPAGLPLGA